ALEYDVDILETDVHLTLDGVPVISHDDNLKSVFGINLKIAKETYSDLSKSIENKKLSKIYIPIENTKKFSGFFTLDQFLDFVKERNQEFMQKNDIKLNQADSNVKPLFCFLDAKVQDLSLIKK
ncbi:MAG: hypothetical protein MHPSP_002225, partial [Paramarteilia canceri]